MFTPTHIQEIQTTARSRADLARDRLKGALQALSETPSVRNPANYLNRSDAPRWAAQLTVWETVAKMTWFDTDRIVDRIIGLESDARRSYPSVAVEHLSLLDAWKEVLGLIRLLKPSLQDVLTNHLSATLEAIGCRPGRTRRPPWGVYSYDDGTRVRFNETFAQIPTHLVLSTVQALTRLVMETGPGRVPDGDVVMTALQGGCRCFLTEFAV